MYYGNDRRLEHDLVVAPGGDPGAIRLGFRGTDKLRVDEQGDLVLLARQTEIRQKKPLAYQESGGTRQIIAARYVLEFSGFPIVNAFQPTRGAALPMLSSPS